MKASRKKKVFTSKTKQESSGHQYKINPQPRTDTLHYVGEKMSDKNTEKPARSPLDALTPVELLSLQKHLKLGKGHLKTCLSEEELDGLFNLVSLPPPARKKLVFTLIEGVGQTTLLLNGSFTAVFGGWLSLSGFLGLGLSQWLFVLVIIASLALGGFMGMHSILLRRKTSQSFIDQRKLQELEMLILKALKKDKKEELDFKTKELSEVLKSLNISIPIKDLEDPKQSYKEVCQEVIGKIQQIKEKDQQSKQSTEAFYSERDKIKRWLQEEDEKQKRDLPVAKLLKNSTQKLSHASTVPEIRFTSWIKARINRLIIELIPTVLGAASSLFVYFGGIPKVAKEFGKKSLFNFLNLPQVKAFELSLVMLFILYFTYSFIHMTRQAFSRDQEIAKMKVLISTEENQLTELEHKLYKIEQIFLKLQPIQRKIVSLNK